MNTIRITTSQNIELEYDLASLGERIVATLLDLLIAIAYVIIVFFAIAINHFSFIQDNLWLVLIILLPVIFYNLVSEILMNGQSVGKKVMNIKVISLDSTAPTLGQYLIRWLFRIVDFTLTNGLAALISVAASARKQRLGDMVAGTTLIKTLPRTHIEDTIYAPTPVTDYTVSFPGVINLADKDMQLVKEVILNVTKTGNTTLAYEAAERIKQVLSVQTNLEPMHFLHILMADYNHLTSKL